MIHLTLEYSVCIHSSTVGYNYSLLTVITILKIITNREKKRQEDSQRDQEEKLVESAHAYLDEEEVAKERKRKMREILIQTFKENLQVRITVPLLQWPGA